MADSLTYKGAGVDIAEADSTKKLLAKSIDIEGRDARVLNRVGAFASLFEAKFEGVTNPVLVLKAEEPGSKQLLAFQHGFVREICFDLVNHLINDIAVMGARPLAVLDVIVCGALRKADVVALVDGMAAACRALGCTLVGGETSEQPGVLEAGRYVLSATVVGVADKSRIVDGSGIAVGDRVLVLPSNGPHTNGYTLIRRLLADVPGCAERAVGKETFLQAVMKPHTPYLEALQQLATIGALKGAAHITGGGIAGNLGRILPPGMDAAVELGNLRIPPIFSSIRNLGKVPDTDMLQTFNLGAGAMVVVPEALQSQALSGLQDRGIEGYPVGAIVNGKGSVRFSGGLNWSH
ncbi:MAG: phosphoribosylformylglycinamidine cyclo-ligase [Oligoflexia bacterium]|nr:phosphoribosylformylglycinamidine cyclo-ligase [Oligoflexia bacterium]